MKRCGEIRKSDCVQMIKDGWKHCPLCGGLLARVSFDEEYIFYSHPNTDNDIQHVRFDYSGNSRVNVNCVFVKSQNSVSLVTPSFTVSESGYLDIKYKPGELDDNRSCVLEITTTDGERTGDDYWNLAPIRMQSAKVINKVTKGKEISIEPEFLFFSSSRDSRKITIKNKDKLPVKLHFDVTSKAHNLSLQSNGFYLRDGKNKINSLHINGEEEIPLIFCMDQNSELSDLELIARDSENTIFTRNNIFFTSETPSMIIPRFIVGIDFGTSNTSVVVRDMKLGSVEFLGKDKRFPTVIYCPDEDDDTTWCYGQHAKDEYMNNMNGVLITDIKSSLRDPQKTNKDSLIRIVEWYFTKLLNDIILPYVKIISQKAEVDILFVFSLPVLDINDPNEEFKTLVLKSAHNSGFNDNCWQVITTSEPFCACLFFLNKRGDHENKLDFSNDDKILIFDSGGGTTDIALATININDSGILSFSEIKQYGFLFGGNTITLELGRMINKLNPNLLPLILKEHSSRDISREEDDQRKEVDIIFKDSWHLKFPKLFRRIEKAKIALGNNDTVKLYTAKIKGRDASIYVPRNYIDDIINDKMKPILKNIKDIIEKNKIKYIFLVGGNSCLPQVVQEVKRQFFNNNMIDISESEKKLAVPNGSIYTDDVSMKIRLYDIEFRTCDNTFLWFVDKKEQKPEFIRELTMNIKNNTKWCFTIYGYYEGVKFLIHTISVVNTSNKNIVSLEFKIYNNILTVSHDGDGEFSEWYRYEI